MSEVDVGILGTGIAAHDCALRLRAHGIRVSLHDALRPKRTRDDGLQLAPLAEALRAQLAGSPLGPPVDAERVSLPADYHVEVPGATSIDGTFAQPIELLDTGALWSRARTLVAERGVTYADAAATDVRFADGRWTIEDRTGEWRVTHVVFALAPTHPWAERFGIEPEAVGEREVLAIAADAKRVPARLHVEIGALPGGHLWLAPIGDRVLAGFASPRIRAAAASRILHAFLSRHDLGRRGTLARRRQTISAIADGARGVEQHGVWIGDDRSHVDPATGASLATALRVAQETADRIIDGAGFAGMASSRDFAGERAHATRLADALYGHPARFLAAVLDEPDAQAPIAERLAGDATYGALFGRLRPTKVRRLINRVIAG